MSNELLSDERDVPVNELLSDERDVPVTRLGDTRPFQTRFKLGE